MSYPFYIHFSRPATERQLTYKQEGTFLLWGFFDATIAILSYLFLRETKGLSLEQIARDDFNAILHHKSVDHPDPDQDSEHAGALLIDEDDIGLESEL